MVYLFYIDPPVLKGNPSEVLSFLRSIQHNVLIPVFEDGELRSEIHDAVTSISTDAVKRKRIESLLERLHKRKRFVYCMESGVLKNMSNLKSAFIQAQEYNLSAIVTDEENNPSGMSGNILIGKIQDYLISNLEENRELKAVEGVSYDAGKLTVSEFLDKNFREIIKYAQKVSIYDKMIGQKNNSDNFIFSIQELLRYISSTNVDPSRCEVSIYTLLPAGKGIHHLKNSYQQAAKNLSVNFSLLDSEGEEGDEQQKMNHDRYMKTDQFTVLVSRGFDLFSESSGMNRDVSLHFVSSSHVSKALTACPDPTS